MSAASENEFYSSPTKGVHGAQGLRRRVSSRNAIAGNDRRGCVCVGGGGQCGGDVLPRSVHFMPVLAVVSE